MLELDHPFEREYKYKRKMSLAELDFNYKHFLDKSTLLFGKSGSGKSFVMVDILYQLQGYVEQVVVISPTDRQNHTYDKGLVPLPCIHYTITPELLDNIWDRQTALSSAYTRANKYEIVKSLFDKIPGNATTRNIIDSIHRKLRDFRGEVANDEDADARIAEMETECKKLITMVWKDGINKNRGALSKLELNSDERYCLKYINLNPRLVLVFDDCTDQLKKYKGHPVMQKLFYQGRHSFITVLIACHTDKALDPELKKSVYVNIFTEESSAHSYFYRGSNDLDKIARSKAESASKSAFTPLAKHQKLVWTRDDDKFYRFTATARLNFKFGSQYVWEYCNQIKADAGTVSADNKFIGDFA